MISHDLHCIFIHTGKTGGTSITRNLLPELESDVDDETENLELFAKHKTAEWYHDHFPEEFKNYFKFTFIRNPWDREVSRFNWQNWLNTGTRGFFPLEFRNWIKEIDHTKAITNTYLPRIEVDGETAVDFVGRFESLEQDYGEIASRLGLESRPLPHSNNLSDRPTYQEYFDVETRNLVAELYKRDIEVFGYHF